VGPACWAGHCAACGSEWGRESLGTHRSRRDSDPSSGLGPHFCEARLRADATSSRPKADACRAELEREENDHCSGSPAVSSAALRLRLRSAQPADIAVNDDRVKA
jgi:hypothetical protein